MNELELKQRLFDFCVDFIEKRLKTIQSQIEDLQESLSSETKSSAGDKHETGRAMLQLEREKIGQQFSEIQKVKSNLQKINFTKTTSTVSLGSLVMTDQANYFIAISAGKIEIDRQIYYAIAANTPMAVLLLGKSKADTVRFREAEIKIQNIF